MKENQLDQVLASLQEPMTATLREWIQVPSLKSEAEADAPFGALLKRMLDLVLKNASELGFEVHNYEGYAGDAQMGEGNDEDALAILAHVDIVPAGDGWTREPFGAGLEGDNLYGRGTSDDKGPLAAALYAMYAVKLAGIPLKRKVKLIIGCDEESGMEDIRYYKKVAVMPRTGFSPDASYPVINLEKGMCGLELTAPVSAEGLQILELHVGERTNVIPGSATAVVKGLPVLAARVEEVSGKYGWPVTAAMEGEKIRITATGINGHAAFPEAARNAIGQMLITLRELGAVGPIAILADAVGTQYYGEGLGIASEDKASGKLTCNLGIIRIEKGKLFATLDIRYPLLIAGERLRDIIAAHIKGIEVKQVTFKHPHYVPESSELVQCLLEAYHEVTGGKKETLSTGGGTYARMLSEGVAFGASFPDDPDLAHQADECISISSLMNSMKIFFRAIVKLAGIEE
jgi:succinyl-diaminopimelate desuccinylase